jgi:hypothetical protein
MSTCYWQNDVFRVLMKFECHEIVVLTRLTYILYIFLNISNFFIIF